MRKLLIRMVIPFFLNSRTIGTCLAALASIYLINLIEENISFSIMLPLLWIFCLFFGAKLHFVIWLFHSQENPPRTSLDWDKGFWFVLIIAVGFTFSYGDPSRTLSHLNVLWIFLSLSYGSNKFSCWINGCCNWNGNWKQLKIIRAIPLQLLESAISLGSGAFLSFWFVRNPNDLLFFIVFVFAHIFVRCLNYFGRYYFLPNFHHQ